MKGVIYARYSSDNQREESIEGQLRECKEYAERNDITILGTYIDRALSAKTDNRPEFQHMIKDSAKGLFDVVLVWKLDRFARNRYNGARYKNFRIKNEVKIIPARENISERSKEIILETMLEGYNVLKHNKGQRRSRRCPLLLPCPRALSSEAMDTAEQMAASALRSLVRLNMPSLEPAHRIKSTGAA